MLVVLVFISALCVAAHAEESVAPLTLSLAEAIRYAQQNNLEVLVLQKQEAVARAEMRIERQRNNPNFLFETTRSSPNYFTGAGYLFELGGKRAYRTEIAAHQAEITDLNLQAGLRSVRHDVRIAFYRAVQSRERQNEIAGARDLAARLLDISRQRFEAGAVARFEVLQAELEMKRAENDAKKEQSQQQSSLIRLNLLLSREPGGTLELMGSLEDRPGEVTLETLVQEALTHHVELLTLRLEEKAEEARLGLARAERMRKQWRDWRTRS